MSQVSNRVTLVCGYLGNNLFASRSMNKGRVDSVIENDPIKGALQILYSYLHQI